MKILKKIFVKNLGDNWIDFLLPRFVGTILLLIFLFVFVVTANLISYSGNRLIQTCIDKDLTPEQCQKYIDLK